MGWSSRIFGGRGGANLGGEGPTRSCCAPSYQSTWEGDVGERQSLQESADAWVQPGLQHCWSLRAENLWLQHSWSFTEETTTSHAPIHQVPGEETASPTAPLQENGVRLKRRCSVFLLCISVVIVLITYHKEDEGETEAQPRDVNYTTAIPKAATTEITPVPSRMSWASGWKPWGFDATVLKIHGIISWHV